MLQCSGHFSLQCQFKLLYDARAKFEGIHLKAETVRLWNDFCASINQVCSTDPNHLSFNHLKVVKTRQFDNSQTGNEKLLHSCTPALLQLCDETHCISTATGQPPPPMKALSQLFR